MASKIPSSEADRYSPSLVAIATTSAIYPLHKQSGFEVIYVQNGGGIMYADGRVRRVQPGDLFFINRTATHGFSFDPDTYVVLAGVSCSLMPQFTDYVEELGLPFFLIENALDDPQIDRAIGHLVTHPTAFKTGIKLMSEFSLLLDALATHFSQATDIPRSNEIAMLDRMAHAAYLEADANDPSLDSLASALGVSRSYVSRLIKPTLGLSFPAYSAVARLNAARRLLVQTTRPINEIARMCHYTSIRTFDRQLFKVAGMTGTEYRAALSESQVINYDLPHYRADLEPFYEQLARTCPSMAVE